LLKKKCSPKFNIGSLVSIKNSILNGDSTYAKQPCSQCSETAASRDSTLEEECRYKHFKKLVLDANAEG